MVLKFILGLPLAGTSPLLQCSAPIRSSNNKSGGHMQWSVTHCNHLVHEGDPGYKRNIHTSIGILGVDHGIAFPKQSVADEGCFLIFHRIGIVIQDLRLASHLPTCPDLFRLA